MLLNDISQVSFEDIEGLIVSKNRVVEDLRGDLTCYHDDFLLKSAFSLRKAIISNTKLARTIRGFHIQVEPKSENKLISCLSGRIDEYFLDLRLESKTFLKYAALSVDSSMHSSIHVPGGVAHAFQTLEDKTSMLYLIDREFCEDLNLAIHPLDPDINISWRNTTSIINRRDMQGLSLQSFLEKYVLR